MRAQTKNEPHSLTETSIFYYAFLYCITGVVKKATGKDKA